SRTRGVDRTSLRADGPARALVLPDPAPVVEAAPAVSQPHELLPVATAAEPAPPALQVQAQESLRTGAKPAVHVSAPGASPRWNQEVGAAVRLFAAQRVQSAEIHVQPAELGPVQLSLRIDAGEANMVLAAPHADTRNALETALPRLREMLSEAGIELGNASVGNSGSF